MLLDRRQFLLTTLAVPATARRTSARRTLLDRGFARVERLADGVYVTLADPSKGPQCLSNGGVIVGRNATLIVEGHFRAEGAALEMEIARALLLIHSGAWAPISEMTDVDSLAPASRAHVLLPGHWIQSSRAVVWARQSLEHFAKAS
jgi:hypothetical protein